MSAPERTQLSRTFMAWHGDIDNHQISSILGFGTARRAQPFRQSSHELVFLDDDDARYVELATRLTVACDLVPSLDRSGAAPLFPIVARALQM